MKKQLFTNTAGIDRYLENIKFWAWEEEIQPDSEIILFVDESDLIKDDDGLYIVKGIEDIDIEYKINS